ncbi:hypothetical protein JTB14_018772 [Gonioctena quinquepunctata]|nr:hypothetical protein JTB14_018772 [Gonioctena quinquepunctata]
MDEMSLEDDAVLSVGAEEVSDLLVEIFDTCDMWEELLSESEFENNPRIEGAPTLELNRMETLYDRIVQAQDTSECIIIFKDRLEMARQAIRMIMSRELLKNV